MSLIPIMLSLLTVVAPGRRTVLLNDGWYFSRVLASASVRGEPAQSGVRLDPAVAEKYRRITPELGGIKVWQRATLPHAAWIRPLNDPKIWQGVVYYRRRLDAPPAGRRTTLVLQGMQTVDVWLNYKYLGARRGGYLPLRAEIREGGDLLVRVDNSDNAFIPPGKPQSQLDFMYGCGLVGNAILETTDLLHVSHADDRDEGIRIDPPIRGAHGTTTNIHTGIQNDAEKPRSFVLRQAAFDPKGRLVATTRATDQVPAGRAGSFTSSLNIASPHLWSPDSPALYRLRTTIEADGRVVDQVETRFGLRSIEVSREQGFVLNGKPLRLIGTNRHQDYPWIGPALSDAANWRDAVLIKRSGHNIVRLSHYNQSPAFLDACDELGILTIPCIPGWQFFNRNSRFQERVFRDIRETIWRDRNHPSVTFWETSLNETYPPAGLAKQWHDAAHEAGAALTAGDDGKDVPWEVTYNGWREDFSRPSNPDRPGYIREYGDYEFGGATSTSRVRIGAGIDKLLNETWNHVWSLNKFRPQFPQTMGEGTWEMFDHNVPWAFAVSASGLCDIMRREKPSFWFFASQAASAPYLKIAADWQPGAAMRQVVVFTNAKQASLFINGRLAQTVAASGGPVTRYDLQKAFDGTNTGNLLHPPIVFRNVPFTAGELRVVGANGAADMLRTAGKPVRLKVWVDDLGVRATRNDVVFVRAAAVDEHGVVCPNVARKARFKGAPFAGESESLCEMGIASVLVRTPVDKATIEVRAEAGGLSGSCRFVVR